MAVGQERDQKEPILEIATWLQSPLGRYLLEWEQQCLDEAVADLFGFHALQPGLAATGWPACQPHAAALAGPTKPGGAQLQCSFDELPFESGSLDLVLLPHTLEMAGDPHHRLREAARVLRPEGRLLILGLNPASLWGLRQRVSPCLPSRGEFIGYWRLRDWLRLLSFDVPQARFGCYRPAPEPRGLAAALGLHGPPWSHLVARLWRRLFHRGGQARAWHALGRSCQVQWTPPRQSGRGLAVPYPSL